MWQEHDLHGAPGEAVKHIKHPLLGPLAFEYSAFAVDGRPDLTLVIYNPLDAKDLARLAALLAPPQDKP